MVLLTSSLRIPLKLVSAAATRPKISSWFENVPLGAPDIILGIHEAFKVDTNPHKIDLSIGAYRDATGKPYPLRSILEAESKLVDKLTDKELETDIGNEFFIRETLKLAVGDDNDLIEKGLYATVQSVSGSGSIRIGAEFLARSFTGRRIIYLPNPTWAYHKQIFEESGIETAFYRHFDNSTHGLNFNGMITDINKIPEKSIILFQLVGHNPTGSDPSNEQWCELSDVVKKRNLFPFFDMAYQGFGSGCLDQDAFGLRKFIADGHKVAIAQSYSKNMGLYSVRVGAMTFLLNHEKEREVVISQLKHYIKCMYGSPPIHGSQIVTEILMDPFLKKLWKDEVKSMHARIYKMRILLKRNLKNVGSNLNWDHITNQKGMFTYSGLDPDQCDRLRDDYNVYIVRNGRIAIPGVTTDNVEYLARSIHAVTQ